MFFWLFLKDSLFPSIPARLNWSFRVAGEMDIEMFILIDDAIVFSSERHTEQDGSFDFQKAGSYIVRYSNTYSSWNSKTVGYSHKIKTKND